MLDHLLWACTHVDFEGLDAVVEQQYVTHHLSVLSVSLQLRRPDIVGSASRQTEARAHHAPALICNRNTDCQRESRAALIINKSTPEPLSEVEVPL